MAKDGALADYSKSKKSYKSWSKSSNNNGYHKEIRVEEIENGFLICLNEWGDINGKYMDKNVKYFAKENPLSDSDLDNGMDSAITEFINTI
jgi:hypothetical protein